MNAMDCQENYDEDQLIMEHLAEAVQGGTEQKDASQSMRAAPPAPFTKMKSTGTILAKKDTDSSASSTECDTGDGQAVAIDGGSEENPQQVIRFTGPHDMFGFALSFHEDFQLPYISRLKQESHVSEMLQVRYAQTRCEWLWYP